MGVITQFSEVSKDLLNLYFRLENSDGEISEEESDIHVSIAEYVAAHENFNIASLEMKALIEHYEAQIQKQEELIGLIKHKKEQLEKKQSYFKTLLQSGIMRFGKQIVSKTSGLTAYHLETDLGKLKVSPSQAVEVGEEFTSEENWIENKKYLNFNISLKNLNYSDFEQIKELIDDYINFADENVTAKKSALKEDLKQNVEIENVHLKTNYGLKL